MTRLGPRSTITRRRAILAMAFAAVVCPLGASPAQGVEKSGWHITVVVSDELPDQIEAVDGFLARITSEHEVWAHLVLLGGDEKRTALLDPDGRDPDLIYAVGPEAVRWASHTPARHEIPVVAGLVRKADLGTSTSITGVVLNHDPEVQLRELQRVLPGAHEVGLVYTSPAQDAWVAAARPYAKRLGLDLVERPLKSPRDLPDVLRELVSQVDVIMGPPDSLVYSPLVTRNVLLLSFRSQVPVMGLSGDWARNGALFALSTDPSDIGRQNATQAVEVLSGRPISQVPPQPPRAVVIEVNTRTAQILGVELEAAVLESARHLY